MKPQNGNITRIDEVELLTMRNLTEADCDLVYAWEQEDSQHGGKACDEPLTRLYVEQYIAQMLSISPAERSTHRMLAVTSQGEPVAMVDLYEINHTEHCAEIGVYVAPEYRGCGVGKKAVALMLDYASKSLHLGRIYARVDIANKASLALFAEGVFSGRRFILVDADTAGVMCFVYDFSCK